MNRHSYIFKWLLVLALQWVSIIVYSQEMASDPVIDKFKSYTGKTINEKLFLHTDKEFYVAGEIIWFKLYYADGTTHKPMEISKLAYVEMMNDKNEAVVQAKVSLLPGDKAGSFYLPVSLPTGYYAVRAYTNWMKNFDAAYFFEKKITVVNTLKNADRQTIDSSAIIDFFPEGGHLVNGIQSKVGFKATNRNGSIKNYRGYIISNTDTIVSFSPYKFGIGNFVFRPVQGDNYKAVIVLPDGSVSTAKLPEIQQSGYVMNVQENTGAQIAVTVYRRKPAGEQNTEQLVLLGHTRQQLVIAQKAYIGGNDSAVFLVDKNKIGKGITQFTIFNSAGKPLSERLFYTRPSREVSVSVSSDRASYGKREKINLSVNASSASAADLSLSVIYLDGLQKPTESTIVDYMWLTSDLAGNVESASWYLTDDPAVAIAADNLMLTHGWRKFNWDDVLSGSDSFIKFLPEINGHLVTGIVKDSRYDKPAADIHAYLSVPGYPYGFYTSQSNANGIVQFNIKNYYGNGRIIAQPGIEMDTFYKVEILKPFAETVAEKTYPYYELSEYTREQLLRRSIGMQAQNIYLGDSLRNFSDPFITDTLPFYGRAEATYKLDDYKRFPTMEEVMREYVREVGVGARNETLVFKIFNPAAHDFYDSHSLVLLDGVPLTNPNRIFRYDPLKIRKLDVLRDRYVMGHSIFNGIASFTSYEGVFDGYELNPNLIAVDYAGLQLKRNFYSPAYETKEQLEKRIPDFRSTLFWTPDITINKNGSASLQFYSSDLPGKYLVLVQGMNEKGDFIAESTTLEVK
jgi:hypothetical protein